MDKVNIVSRKDRSDAVCNLHLGVIDIEIIGAQNVIKATPNSLIVWAVSGFEGLGEGFGNLKPDLGGEGEVFEYRTSGVSLRLTKPKLKDLLFRALSALDYFVLRESFGIFHEIHEDFYDPETGEALQPM